MIKLFLNIILCNAVAYGAAADDSLRGEVPGTISPTGVTYAIKRNLKEGVERGLREPFAQAVCQIFCLQKLPETTLIFDHSTITKIAHNTYIGCTHTAKAMSEFLARPKPEIGEYYLGITSGSTHAKVSNYRQIFHPDPNFDLAIMNFECITKLGSPEFACEILELATSDDKISKDGTAFVVSHGDVFIAGLAERQAKWTRALSIHEYSREVTSAGNYEFSSSIYRKLLDSTDEEDRDNLFKLTKERLFTFPAITSDKKYKRLITALAGGMSGSPLIGKFASKHKIIGLYYEHVIDYINDSVSKKLLYKHRFIDLTQPDVSSWIQASVAALRDGTKAVAGAAAASDDLTTASAG